MAISGEPYFCTADTASGKVRGLVSGGIRQFKGVPYGATTAGANRFRRPQPVAPWTGVCDCLGYGPVSPQLPSDISSDYARLIQFDLNVAFGGMSEDCLRLNIWTPDASAKRAVLVSIHGGGFAIGSGNHPMYDGARLAGFGDVVVVTVTHRLASFGYLNLMDVRNDEDWSDAGCAGILDLVTALEWVRDNIAEFGGDPNCVTIFGQSGGGWKVSTLLAMSSARGLFHRAAIQSGSLLRHQSREEGARVAHAFVNKLGLTPSSLSEIRNLPWLQLLAAQEEVGAHLYAPVLDGSHLVHDPFHPAAPTESVSVPLIVSTTLDDAGLFLAHFDLTEPALMNILSEQYGEPATRMLELYRGHFPMKSPYLLHAQIMTDAGFRRLSHEQAEQKARLLGAPVYSYLWEWTSPAYEGKFGAAHAMDVSASFHNDRDALLGCGSREAQLMCDDLAATWIQFAKTGDPNNKGIPKWPPYDAEKRSTLNFGPNTRIVDDPYGEIRAFWLGMPGPSGVLG